MPDDPTDLPRLKVDAVGDLYPEGTCPEESLFYSAPFVTVPVAAEFAKRSNTWPALAALARDLQASGDPYWADRAAAALAPPADQPAGCTHPDRGATVPVTCPKCHTAVTLPADPVDHATDRFCPVCNAQLPYLPAAAG